MKVCVQGLWHLGSVTAACLASVEHDVVGLGIEQAIVDDLNQGMAPLFEPGLNELIAKGIANKSLRFVVDPEAAVKDADILWVTFDTPVDDDDRADVDFVIQEIRTVLPKLADNAVILISSQLPVGSIRELEKFVEEFYPKKGLRFASSPENLRLGKSLEIFLNPDRVVVGVRTLDVQKKLEKLFFPFTNKIEWMSIESAEMTKHAINSFLAVSVTFANEIASICELVGADAKEVERGLKSESRIGVKAYLSPGGPFAGGTLARDVEFLGAVGRAKRLAIPLLTSVRLSNDEHKNWVRRKLIDKYSDLSGVTVAVWGLTYKPGTDTLRRSLAVELCNWLVEQGAKVHIYDPVVKVLPEHWNGKVIQCTKALDAVLGSDVLVVGTEWPEFRNEAANLSEVAKPDLVIIDANRHLQNSVDTTKVIYIAVGSALI